MSTVTKMTSKFQSESAIIEAGRMLNKDVKKVGEELHVNINGHMTLKLKSTMVGGKKLFNASYDNMDEGKVRQFFQAANAAETKQTLLALGYTMVSSTPVTNITQGKNTVLRFQ